MGSPTVTQRSVERGMGLRQNALSSLAQLFASGAGYRIVRIPAGAGRYRRVARPTLSVGGVLQSLRKALESQLSFTPHDSVHGCVQGRSILTNATCHLARPVVLRVDIKRFFESITSERVEGALLRAGMDEQGAKVVVACTTLEGILPTGFSTSPFLANLCFDETDASLFDLCQGVDVTYTRYVDDLVFSGDVIDNAFLQEVRNRLESRDWVLNEKKTRFMRRGGPQYVTGLSVDDASGPHVPRHTKRFLRLEVHYVVRDGFSASSIGRNRLFGMINFVKHVNPELGHHLHAELRRARRITGWQHDEDEEVFDPAAEELYWQMLDVPDDW